LQDISLNQQEGPKQVHEEVLVGKQILSPHDTLDDEFRVELEEEPTQTFEEKQEEEYK
jgi:hypothetical protein